MAQLAAAELERLVRKALAASGANEAMAAATARCLVAADAEGLGTHGVARVPNYCAHLKSGRANGRAVPEVVRDHRAVCLVDAHNGLAFQACELAMDEGVRRANEFGTAFTGVTNSHHCGALGVLLERVAARGCVAFAFSNASAAIMPWGGTRPLYGTNPVAAIFPRADGDPLVVDLSLTQVTRGQIALLARDGKPVPEGWGMDAQGQPTTDPKAILMGGSLHAVGGLKGTMLALAVELLCCALTGSALSHQVASMHTGDGPPLRLGQVFWIIDPAAAAGRDVYFTQVEALIDALLADTGQRLPGARRVAARAEAVRSGIAVDDQLLRELQELAKERTG